MPRTIISIIPGVNSIICAGNQSEVGEYCNRNIDWIILLKSFLIFFTTMGIIVVFFQSLDWVKMKKKAAEKECQPELKTPSLQGAGEDISNDDLHREQQKGIIKRYQKFPIETRQANYVTITN
ncbi:hypothetical protein EAF00_007917 [Botryotinia globosa]|nr:hypothetical protein EAF00_007917 [Botryotinia globosa]